MKCEECGGDLDVQGELDVDDDALREHEVNVGKVWVKATCSNPDCPTRDSDLAKATGPDGAQ